MTNFETFKPDDNKEVNQPENNNFKPAIDDNIEDLIEKLDDEKAYKKAYNKPKIKEGSLGKLRDWFIPRVEEGKLPTNDHESTVGLYGGKIQNTSDGRMILNMQGFWSRFDRWGDPILRTYDEHVIKNPNELLKRHPEIFFKFLIPGSGLTKRSRNKEGMAANIERLGLADTYGPHPDGIEIKNQAVFRDGLPLQDIYRADLISSEATEGFDRLQALTEASKYLRKIHDEYGAVGEVLVSDIIFQKKTNGQVSEPILNIPDIAFNPEKKISEREKKATDILDFLISVGVEEFRASSGDMDSVKQAMRTLLESYDDKYVISLVKSYIKRGRLVLLGDRYSAAVKMSVDTFTTKNRSLFTKHNEARVGTRFVKSRYLEAILKDIGLKLCEEIGQTPAEDQENNQ